MLQTDSNCKGVRAQSKGFLWWRLWSTVRRIYRGRNYPVCEHGGQPTKSATGRASRKTCKSENRKMAMTFKFIPFSGSVPITSLRAFWLNFLGHWCKEIRYIEAHGPNWGKCLAQDGTSHQLPQSLVTRRELQSVALASLELRYQSVRVWEESRWARLICSQVSCAWLLCWKI